MLRQCGLVAIGCSISLLPLPPHTARRIPRRHKYKGAFYALKSNISPGASCRSPLLLLLQYTSTSFSNSYTSPQSSTNSIFEYSRQGFGRGGNNKSNNPPKSPAQASTPQHQATMSNSPSISSSLSVETQANDPEGPKYFFQEKYAPLNVRGNFLTLCACPKNVELGEWLAHQSKQCGSLS